MWTLTEDERVGVVVCSFRSCFPHSLTLELGETVHILEKCEGWFRGFSLRRSDIKGVFPSCYIHVKKCTVTSKGSKETVVPVEDVLVTEVTSTLQEWACLWKQLYVRHKVELFFKLGHVMSELIDLRRQLLSGQLTHDQNRDIKRHVTARLDWGNENLGLDLVPRKDFAMVDEDQISVSDLYKMHVSSRHNAQHNSSQAEPSSHQKPGGGDACKAPVAHHLLLHLKSFTSNNIGEDTDIFFSLYDCREGKSISEKFLVRLNKNGGAKNHEKAERLSALFTDLSNKDMKRDLYIISQVIRTGRMLLNDSKKGPAHVRYRRPYGCAVLAMSDVLQTISELREEKDFVLKVYMCNNENEWYQIHENIIRKSSTKYSAPGNNYGLIISLQLLRGDLEDLRREKKAVLSGGVAMTRKLGFPDVIMPGDVRNDLYLTLERGDFERGGKSVQKNIEVGVFVLSADGELVKDCVSLGCGEPNMAAHRSFVLYHNNSPRWSEAIKLPIPIDRFRGSHLRFEFRHCSTKDKGEKKLFGFSFTPLMRDDGTTLSDQSHELFVYKCDDNTTFSHPAHYLGLPCCKDHMNLSPGVGTSLLFQRSTRETFWISTQLSSTKLTQNVDLLALLKWKAHPDRVSDILGRLRHISGEEIVKFLQDILDTLFSILDDNTDKYGPLVFQSLVFIINLLRDSKYFHFRPVMDTYIHKHFAGALAYKELIRCLKWSMERSVEAVRQDHTQEVMRALEYLIKFIVQSRVLYSRATCGLEEEQFRSSIQELFHSIRLVLSLDRPTCETLIFTQGPQPGQGPSQAPTPPPGQVPGGVQVTCAQVLSANTLRPPPLSAALFNSFPSIFDQLLHMFAVQEVAEFVRGTLASVPSTLHVGHAMDAVKLQFIARTVDSRLFSFPESRRILLPVVLHHIHLHLRHQKELLMCCGILTSLFSVVQTTSLDASVQEEVEMMVESLLDVLLQTLLSVMSKGQSQEAGEFVSCLLSLLRHMTNVHFEHLMENYQSKEELKEFMMKIWCVFRNLMRLSIFPRDWNVMRLLTSHIILTTVQHLSPFQHNFAEDDFDFKVWNSYFSLAVLYINQPSLQLENMIPSKRKKILDKYGDMRVMMTYQLFNMWQNLGDNKIHFIPGMIGPFLGVTLVPQAEVRNIMIPIFHDMMDWEQRKHGHFKQVEAELIDKLDSLVSEGKGDENYRELFSLLTQLFGPYPSLLEKVEHETWRETGISFVTSVTRLMERLLDYRDCMKGDETENKKIGCTVNILNFYKSEINKEEMYVRYVHKLCDMHLQADNYTEAAFTLLLYWELLHWDERPMKDFLHYPAQSEWHRKEALGRKVIHYFNKGKCWEFGIPLCRELAFQYESLYDYQSLSWIRKLEAAYFDNIMEHQRLEPEFFRVGFYGRKFPFFLRNKEFVCRGHDYERLEAFQQRMLGEFPQAIAMQHPKPPEEAILQCDAQYLQIYAVTPVPEAVGVLQLDRVPDRIKSFYRVNNVRRFRHDRPFHKGPKDRENEFKSLWIERTTLVLAHPLPGISRWFEVEKRELVEVSPLENAICVVENKNQELRTLFSQYQHKQLHNNVNLLSMTLNGVIDAAVNGGIARYQEAFFDKDYISSHPEDSEKITQLKNVMQEQVHILGTGLAVHENLVHPEMRPLHKKLIDQFQVLRNSLCHGPCALDRANPPKGIVATHGLVSPERFKVHRHSEMANVGNLFILADGMLAEQREDFYAIQASHSSSSLSSTHSAPSQLINSSLPAIKEPSRTNRDILMLLPPQRDQPSGIMYQQRAFFHQVISPGCKPCSDPNLSFTDKVLSTPSSWSLDSGTRDAVPVVSAHIGSIMAPPVPPRNVPHGQHLSMHFDAFHHQLSDLPPALPARSLRKYPLQPSPASPTSPASNLDGSNSTLSGSISSGVFTLSESNLSDPPSGRTDTLESVSSSRAWTSEQEDFDSPYWLIRYDVSALEIPDTVNAEPCRSQSSYGTTVPQSQGFRTHRSCAQPQPRDHQDLHSNPHHVPTHLPLGSLREPPPALSHLREGLVPGENPFNSPSAQAAPPHGPGNNSHPPLAATKEEQAKVAWGHGISEE
ncbi:dedicator of cytokinesis protein 3-like isoform X2 [Dunckerocampus dactyliophorus]|uniref:dedicator of cytokinesis protein 3-like isoform X2 n=1 Tax=Dunckerocampus dactyliophorus TaxID=161453 RepID=UPI002405CB4A|nr:dedicator of cytokinesis protein 3-like isoform X2 [Dunckerocampus dactyliophorus]